MIFYVFVRYPFSETEIMLNRRSLLSAAVATSALSLGVRPSIMRAADDYPNRLIRIIVGYATGGNVDVPARLFAPELQRILGVPVIIENRPGASGVTAAEALVHMPPDGYNIIWATSASHSVSVVALAPLPFDPVKDFSPITLISEDPNVIVCTSDFPAADSIGAESTFRSGSWGLRPRYHSSRKRAFARSR